MKLFLTLFIFIVYTNPCLLFNAEETMLVRHRICNNLVTTCNKCADYKKEKKLKLPPRLKKRFEDAVVFNKFSYGVPFIANKEYYSGPCDCKKLIKAKTLCNELDKSDPLPGLSQLDLNGVLVKDSGSAKKKNQNKAKTNLRFVETSSKIIKHSGECNCLNEVDAKSLFCEDKCKNFNKYLKQIQDFYDSEKSNIEAILDEQIRNYS